MFIPSDPGEGLVKVAIPMPRLPGEKRCYEWLAARPVGDVGRSGAGIYCLYNSAFFSPFGLGDLVRVRSVGKRLEVIALHTRGGRTTYYVAWDETADEQACLATQAEWRAAGAWLENLCEHRLVVSVDDLPEARPTWAELTILKRSAPLRDLEILAHPDDSPDDTGLFGHLRAA